MLLNKKINHLLFIFGAIFAPLHFWTYIATAQTTYNPPEDSNPQTDPPSAPRDPACNEDPLNLFSTLIPNHIDRELAEGEFDAQYSAATSQSHPTFWFYIPEAYRVRNVEFSVRAMEAPYQTYETALNTIPSGIFAVQIPESETGLAEGATYEIHLYINAHLTETSLAAECETINFVKRKPLTTETDLDNLPTEQRTEIYAQNGFWFDALTELGQAVCGGASPENWRSFLTDPHFAEFQSFEPVIANATITTCPSANLQSE
ncbi:MAG: DUF928 domain-containing protein [Spirulina sp. SIO3F2]|nr:DUF928 domain-containing protein [Spirulina sp. SIO3F2]